MSEPDDTAPEADVTLWCDQPGCSWSVTGAPKGRGSAPMKLGQHKYSRHGVRGEKSGRRKAGDATDAQQEAHPVISAVRDAGNAVRNGKTAPSAKDLAAFGGKLFGYGTMAAATHLVETDETIPEGPDGDQERKRIIRGLVLDEETGAQMLAPLGRVLAPTRVNQKFGRALVDNIDVVETVVTIGELASNWRTYLRQRRQGMQPEPEAEAFPTPYLVPTETADAAPEPDLTTAGGTMPAGRVITPDDVQAMRRGETL